MTANATQTAILFFVIASALGLSAVLVLAFYVPVTPSDTPLRKPIIGSIFTIICFFGGLAALYPRRCSRVFGSHGENKSMSFHTAYANNHGMRGHHPDCGQFSAHTMEVRKRVLCAACTGLSLGAVVATVGAATYFFTGLEIEQVSLPSIAIGVGFIILGFAQFKFKGFTRLMLNALFVIGAFSVLIGMDALTKNLFVDSYLISLIVLWILTRILLSEWDHTCICRSCTLECKIKM